MATRVEFLVISQSGDVMKKLSRRHTDFGDDFFKH